jgi:hypothetical protein
MDRATTRISDPPPKDLHLRTGGRATPHRAARQVERVEFPQPAALALYHAMKRQQNHKHDQNNTSRRKVSLHCSHLPVIAKTIHLQYHPVSSEHTATPDSDG